MSSLQSELSIQFQESQKCLSLQTHYLVILIFLREENDSGETSLRERSSQRMWRICHTMSLSLGVLEILPQYRVWRLHHFIEWLSNINLEIFNQSSWLVTALARHAAVFNKLYITLLVMFSPDPKNSAGRQERSTSHCNPSLWRFLMGIGSVE